MIDRQIEILRLRDLFYYEELAHGVTEIERFPGLLSAGWRPRRASGVIQSKPKGLRTRGTAGVSSIQVQRPENWRAGGINYCLEGGED